MWSAGKSTAFIPVAFGFRIFDLPRTQDSRTSLIESSGLRNRSFFCLSWKWLPAKYGFFRVPIGMSPSKLPFLTPPQNGWVSQGVQRNLLGFFCVLEFGAKIEPSNQGSNHSGTNDFYFCIQFCFLQTTASTVNVIATDQCLLIAAVMAETMSEEKQNPAGNSICDIESFWLWCSLFYHVKRDFSIFAMLYWFTFPQ